MPSASHDIAEESRQLFEEVWSLPVSERAARLAEIGNQELRTDVEHLLAAAGVEDSILAPFMAALPAPSESDPLIGATVSHFRIEAHLGSGGMGVVYRATDLKLGRTVALKFLPPDLTRSEEARERFVQEAKAASALDHPHICDIHEIGETGDGRTFIAMAFYEGETLREKIARGPLPAPEAVRYTIQIAEALAAAHAKGIVHRDVKPGNVIITLEDEVKLLDFGLAKLADVSLTRAGSTLGTPSYMSPEQARGEEVDHRTDLWSLGVVLYEMLTGVRPFRGEHAGAVVQAILNEEPEPVGLHHPEIPPEVARLTRRLLSKHPEDRPFSAREVIAGLQGLKIRRRLRRRWIMAGVLLVALAAAAAVYLVLRSRGEPGWNPRLVLVVPFENRTGDPRLDGFGVMAADWITEGLTRTGFVKVRPTSEVMATVAYLRQANTPRGEWLRALNPAHEAAIVIEGKCYRPEETLQCTVQISDAAKGVLLQALPSITGKTEGELVTEIGSRVISALSFHLDPRLAQYENVTHLPPRREAYEEYLKGVEAYLSDDRDPEGHFERATELDTTFLRPLIWQAKINTLFGWDEHNIPIYARLAVHRSELNAYDQAHLDFVKCMISCTSPEELYEASRRMMEAAPGSQEALRETALNATRTRRYRESIELISRHMEGGLVDVYDVNAYLVKDYHMLGEFEKELQVARRTYDLRPDYYTSIMLLRAYAATRQSKAIATWYEDNRTMDDLTHVLIITAHELRAHGQDASQVLEFTRKALVEELKEPAQNKIPRFQQRMQLSWVLFYQGRFTEARQLIDAIPDRLTMEGKLDPADAMLVQWYYGNLDLSIARTIDLADLHLIHWHYGSLNLLKGLVAVRTGRRAEAIRILKERQTHAPQFRGFWSKRIYQWENAVLAAWTGDMELARRLYPADTDANPQLTPCRRIEEEPLWDLAWFNALHRPVD